MRQALRTGDPRIHRIHCRIACESVSGYVPAARALACWLS